MDTNTSILTTILIVVTAGVVWLFVKLKANQDEIKALVEARFSGQTIHQQDLHALLVAQESRGYSQKRGNGNLILTDRELFFAMPLPKTVHSIPLKSITGLERVNRMGGKCIMRPLMKVNYIDEAGDNDALGFHVKEMEAWETAIRSKIS